MSVFEDLLEVHYNATRHESVLTISGPVSIETIHEAVDVWEGSNDRRDGTLVVDHPTAAEFDRGWVEVTDQLVPHGHEEFDPVEGMVTIVEQLGQPAGLIVRSDAVRLDMEILEADGVVAIDFEWGESD